LFDVVYNTDYKWINPPANAAVPTNDWWTNLLVSQFAGDISGFDLGDGVDLRSLGFGSSSGAIPWMQQTSGADGGGPANAVGGGHIFSLTLLGQYAANFSAGSDGHFGAMITDPTASGSVAPTPLVAPHSW